MMVHYFILAALLPLFSTAARVPNSGNQSIVRTFSGFFRTVTDEPLEYLDVLEGSGSGFSQEQERAQRHSAGRREFYITEEVSEFLTSRLATVFIPTIYTLIFIISVPLNALAVIMFIRRVQPRKPAAIYMLNLACADLLFVLLLPFRIAYLYNGNNWIFGSAMCRVVTAAFYCNMYCSVLLITCIAGDRFLAVVYPIDSLTWRSPRTASGVCAAMWLLSIGGVTPLLASEHTMHLSKLGITTCHDVMDITHLQGYYIYFFPIFSSLFFFIPFMSTTVFYIGIIQTLRALGTPNRARRTRAVAMAATVFALFAACFAPTNIILLMHYLRLAHAPGDASYAAYLVATCLGSLSCCVDPLIYYFGSSHCQKQVLAYFSCRPTLEGSQFSSTSTSGSTTSSKLETFKNNLSSQYRKLLA